ncbi:MAG: hypothetical protein JWN94_4128 [Betaproteobacteria bacterium]|jgi:hypothetical protein|nr:hypothetical protein [Betaproteobacteria bacterium]
MSPTLRTPLIFLACAMAGAAAGFAVSLGWGEWGAEGPADVQGLIGFTVAMIFVFFIPVLLLFVLWRLVGIWRAARKNTR